MLRNIMQFYLTVHSKVGGNTPHPEGDLPQPRLMNQAELGMCEEAQLTKMGWLRPTIHMED